MNKLVILISGRGSNMQAIVEACENGKLSAEVTCVLSNRPDSQGLAYAKEKGLQTAVVDHTLFENRADFEAAMIEVIDQHQPDWVILAGFMRILEHRFVNHYLGKLLNIHPSLLPKYPGIKTHQRALEAGDLIHGASVHFVTPELDGGPVIAQVSLDIESSDTAESLANRLIPLEHSLYTQTIQWLINHTVEWKNNVVYYQKEPLSRPIMLSKS